MTAFLYAPFGKVLVPYLDFLKVTVEKLSSSEKSVAAQEFEIDPNRLKQQIIYFTVTAQVVNFALEVVLPFVQRKVFKAVEKVQHSNDKSPAASDVPEEAAFLSRVRNEAELGVYDVSGDYREMAVQFGEWMRPGENRCLFPSYPDMRREHSGLTDKISRLSYAVFGNLAPYARLFSHQQLGRASLRCRENLHQ